MVLRQERTRKPRPRDQERFNPIARRLELVEGQLPERPTTKVLVDLAASTRRGNSLRQEVLDAGAPLVITLGNEALSVLRSVADSVTGAPSRLTAHGYGTTAELVIDGRTCALLPLAHPGFLRQTTNREWRDAFIRWKINVVVAGRQPTSQTGTFIEPVQCSPR